MEKNKAPVEKFISKKNYLSLDRAVLVALRALEPNFVKVPKVIPLTELVGAVRLATQSTTIDEEDVLMSLTTLAANMKFRRMDVVRTEGDIQIIVEGEERRNNNRPSVTEAGKHLGFEWSQYWLTKKQRAVVRYWGKINSKKIRAYIREFDQNSASEIMKENLKAEQADRKYADDIIEAYKMQIENSTQSNKGIPQ